MCVCARCMPTEVDAWQGGASLLVNDDDDAEESTAWAAKWGSRGKGGSPDSVHSAWTKKTGVLEYESHMLFAKASFLFDRQHQRGQSHGQSCCTC